MATLIARSRVDSSPGQVFAWHARRGALERLTPPWERLRVVERVGSIHDGDLTVLELRAGPLRIRWEALHGGFVEGVRFEDEQRAGPFRAWRHTHLFEPAGDGTRLTDRIDYQLPMGALGRALSGSWARRRLERMFLYRHRVLAEDLRRHRGLAPLRIAVSGATGLVGRALCAFLSTGGHEVVRLVRTKAGGQEAHWDPARGEIDAERLEGLDGFVHLAGENVGARWTAARRKRIRDSRVHGTRLVAETLARLRRPPRVLVSASAIGIYGDQPSEPSIDERAPAGDGFLAEVCREWEAATQPVEQAGVRVVNARIGIVLTPAGGALAKLLPVFQAGVGGRVGSGRQGMSWIALDDLLYGILHAIVTDGLRGPVNLTAPEPARNAELTRTLASVLERPALLPLPSLAVKALFGQMGRELLLGGARVLPRRLLDAGFSFAHPTLEGALRHLLGRAPGLPPGFTLE